MTQKRTPEVTSDRAVTWENLLRHGPENIQTTTMEITIKQLAQNAIKSNITIQNTLTTKVTELETQLKELDELIASCSPFVVLFTL